MNRLDRNTRTKTLIAVFFICLLAIIACTTLQLLLGITWIYFASIVFVLVSMVAWSLIRETNGRKDTVPEDQLDEYERSVLDTWRKRALKAFSVLTCFGGFAFLLAGSLRDASDSTALMAAGYFMLFTFLVVHPLPMIGYAITFNRKEA